MRRPSQASLLALYNTGQPSKLDYVTLACRAHGLPDPVKELRFHPERAWRWDYAWPEKKLCLELMGGLWNNGAHVRGARYEIDCEKAAEGTLLGWRVIWASPGQVKSGKAIEWVKRALLQM